jgi:DNA-binding CsgD family transcriptional regulator
MENIASNLISSHLPTFLLSFEMEHLLSLPCHVYWKNKKGVYLGYNDYGAKRLGFNQGKEVSGSSDFEVFSQCIATEYKKNDHDVMTQKKQIFFHEDGILKDGLKVIFCSYKIPLFDCTESVVGVLGLSFTRASESNCFPSQLEQNLNYHPSMKYRDKALSKMEITCIRHLCHGLTIKQIARLLKLSPKTVETYVDRAKIKYNCRNKAELIWTMANKFSIE